MFFIVGLGPGDHVVHAGINGLHKSKLEYI